MVIGVFGCITKGTLNARAKIISSSLQFAETTIGRTESQKSLLFSLPIFKKSCFCGEMPVTLCSCCMTTFFHVTRLSTVKTKPFGRAYLYRSKSFFHDFCLCLKDLFEFFPRDSPKASWDFAICSPRALACTLARCCGVLSLLQAESICRTVGDLSGKAKIIFLHSSFALARARL